MGSITYLVPLVAIVLGWALLGETPPWLAVAGGAVCLVGVYLSRRPWEAYHPLGEAFRDDSAVSAALCPPAR